MSWHVNTTLTSTPMTKPRPNKDADYLEDLRCLERSVLDAMNLINFQWFLYDEARRKAWLEHMKEPPNHQSESAPLAAGSDIRLSVPGIGAFSEKVRRLRLRVSVWRFLRVRFLHLSVRMELVRVL